MADRYPRLASLKTADAFEAHLRTSGIDLAFDRTLAAPEASPLAAPLDLAGVQLPNRFAILPMEGWDGTTDGRPTDLTRRRWQHFGRSGATLIWGGEAVAVRPDGRANPRQLMLSDATEGEIGALRDVLIASHTESFGAASAGRLVLGLQLTHSGRFAKWRGHHDPDPITAYAHPLLDRRFKSTHLISDEELDRLIEEFVRAAARAAALGFQFVDIKHCHGYLGHELLSARTRPGKYGGSIENRTRFLREIVAGIRASSPGLGVGVRLSAFDTVPYVMGADRIGIPQEPAVSYTYAFGRLDDGDVDATLADSREFVGIMRGLGVRLLCVTGGSPYYCPHVIRPATFPPSDGYDPPEDPLRGVARHLRLTAGIKARFPDVLVVGSGYSYLQEWLPHVAQASVRSGGVDVVGIGRLVLSYPDAPADILAGRPMRRKAICRTFSDCTTAPRNGLVSGCYPLDDFYVKHPDAEPLKAVKAETRNT